MPMTCCGDIVAADRLNVQAVEQRRRRRDAGLLRGHRPDAAVEKAVVGGLPRSWQRRRA